MTASGGPLSPEVRAFVDAVAAELAALLGKPAADHVADVVVEASNLVAAIIDNDYLNGETIRLDGALRMPPK